MNQKNKDIYLSLYAKYGDIKIQCQAAMELPLDTIADFQNGLKKRSNANKIRLATQIFSKGFIAPFFIWNRAGDYLCLDGHGRSEVLCEIREAGIPIPSMFPVAYIKATDEKDAKEKLLAITSQYGNFDILELDQWIKDIDNEIKESLRLVNREILLTEFIDPNKEWKEMPEFIQESKEAFRSIIIHFKNQKAINNFMELINQTITSKTKYLWYPAQKKDIVKNIGYKSES